MSERRVNATDGTAETGADRGAGAEAGRPRRESGLQGERTALAWTRTGLAVLVNAALLLRAGLLQPSRPLAACGAALLIAAAAVTLYGARRKRQLASSPPLPAAPPAAMLALAAVALITCVAAVPALLGVGMR